MKKAPDDQSELGHPEAPLEHSQKPGVTLEFEKLAAYIETDLWSRFQTRLWKVVASVLTGVAIAGLLGIPYYIRSEIEARLQTQSKLYSDRLDEVAAYAKALSLLQSEYDSEISRLKFDANSLIPILSNKEDSKSIQKPSELLNNLVSEPDFSLVVKGGPMVGSVFHMLPIEALKMVVAKRSVRIVGNAGFRGAGGFSEEHPVLDGTLGGSLKDFKYRIAIIEALRRTIDSVDDAMLQAGGVNETEKRIAELKVVSLKDDIVMATFRAALREIAAGDFLDDQEKKDFERFGIIYTPSIFKKAQP
jgi:hypothetical protein